MEMPPTNGDKKQEAEPFLTDPTTGTQYSVVKSLKSPFIVTKPIPVTIREIDGSFVASFEEANVNASGDTWFDALSNLKAYIVDIFGELSAHQEALGPSLRRDFLVMQRFVEIPVDGGNFIVIPTPAAVLGRQGGSRTSLRKAVSSAANGHKGGRPRKPEKA